MTQTIPKNREIRKWTSLGPLSYVRYNAAKARQVFGGGRAPFALTSQFLNHQVLCRPKTSDIRVFKQIFIDLEYRCLNDCREPQLILDCGANVGYSSTYFLNRFPNAKVVAIEPDEQNYAMLQRNVAPYGDRCLTLRAAVWPESTSLKIADNTAGRGQEWGRQVVLATERDSALPGVDILTVLRQYGFSRIGLLKVDIEGAERHVFGPSAKKWIDFVDNIVIELHDEECRQRFFEIVDRDLFETSRCEELTVCKRRAA